MTHRALALGSRSTGRPISGYPLDSALSRDPDPSYAATSPAHRKARPSIFPIKRDTTTSRGARMTRRISPVAVCCSRASLRALVISAYDGPGGAVGLALRGVPHASQNVACGRFSCWHRGHRIPSVSRVRIVSACRDSASRHPGSRRSSASRPSPGGTAAPTLPRAGLGRQPPAPLPVSPLADSVAFRPSGVAAGSKAPALLRHGDTENSLGLKRESSTPLETRHIVSDPMQHGRPFVSWEIHVDLTRPAAARLQRRPVLFRMSQIQPGLARGRSGPRGIQYTSTVLPANRHHLTRTRAGVLSRSEGTRPAKYIKDNSIRKPFGTGQHSYPEATRGAQDTAKLREPPLRIRKEHQTKVARHGVETPGAERQCLTVHGHPRGRVSRNLGLSDP